MNQLYLLKNRYKKPTDPFKISEHELMSWCLGRLQMAQYYVWRYNAGKLPIRSMTGKIERMIIIGQKGVSDIIGISPTGMFCAFEIKIKPNKLSPAQVEFLEEVKRRGGIGEVFYTTEDCEKFCNRT